MLLFAHHPKQGSRAWTPTLVNLSVESLLLHSGKWKIKWLISLLWKQAKREKHGFSYSQEPAQLLHFKSWAASQIELGRDTWGFGGLLLVVLGYSWHLTMLAVVLQQLMWILLLFTHPVLLLKTNVLRFLEKYCYFLNASRAIVWWLHASLPQTLVTVSPCPPQ